MSTFFLFLFSSLAHAATLALLRPLQAQHPRIARPSFRYSWSFDSSSFGFQDDVAADPQSISYSATALPPWLMLHQDTLSFIGNVPSSAVSSNFTIVVTASVAGQAVNDTVQLFISSEPEPQIAIPIAQQILSNSAAVSSAFVVRPGSALAPYFSTPVARDGKAGVRIPPGWSFSIGLEGGTFAPWPLLYQASLADGEPLPDWIRYDGPSFTFTGVAPSGRFAQVEVMLMATDIAGYSTNTRDSFWISIAADDFGLREALAGVSINVTIGERIDCEISHELLENATFGGDPLSSLALDIKSSEIITFDHASRRITGPNMNGSELEVPMNITDSQNVTVHTKLHLLPMPSLFTSPNLSLSLSTGDGSVNPTRSDTDGAWVVPLRAFLSETGLAQMSRGQVELFARLEQSPNVSLHLEPESSSLLINHMDSYMARREDSPSTRSPGAPVARKVNTQILVSGNGDDIPPPIDIVVTAFSSVFNTNSSLHLEIDPSMRTECQISNVSCSPMSPPSVDHDAGRGQLKRRHLAAILVAMLLSILITALAIICACRRRRCGTWMPCSSPLVRKTPTSTIIPGEMFPATRGRLANPREIEKGAEESRHTSSLVTLAATRSDNASFRGAGALAIAQRVPTDHFNDKESTDDMLGNRRVDSSSRVVEDALISGAAIAAGDMRWQVESPYEPPAPSIEGGTVHPMGNTVPKHAFFALIRSPLSSPVNSKPPSLSSSPPMAGLFNGFMPMLRASSLGSLLGFNKPSSSNNSSNSFGISKSQESRDAFKTTISKPRLPRQFSEEKMASELDASMSLARVTRQTSDDGGAGFQAGTAIIYPKVIRATEPVTFASLDPPLDPSTPPLFILEQPAIPQEIPALLRKRSNESEAAGYIREEDFVTSSQSTIEGGVEETLVAKDSSDGPGRQPQVAPLSSAAESDASPTQPLRKAVYISESLQSGCLPSSTSTDSVVLTTATLAVRSPHTAGVKFVPSPKPTIRSSLDNFRAPSSPLNELASSDEPSREKCKSNSRLVAFVNEVQYDGGSSSDGGYRHGSAAYASYEGTRERSQKAVVGGLSGTPPSSWNEPTGRPTQSRIPVISQATSMRLVDQVLQLRLQSRQNCTGQRVNEEWPTVGQASPPAASHPPSDDSSFQIPRSELGVGYKDPQVSDGEISTSGYHPSPRNVGSRFRSNNASERELQVSSIEDTDDSQPVSTSFFRQPPQIPLPALPSHSSNYFDLSESSSASSSDSAVIRHTGGMDRILVGAREPFHFLAPLQSRHSSPGKMPRTQVLVSLRERLPCGKFTAQHAPGDLLPPWLNFDEKLVEFWGVPGVDIGGLKLEIALCFGDGTQTQEVGRFILEVVGH